MIIQYYWPNCSYRNKVWEALPIDAFWVEATVYDAQHFIYPFLDEASCKESEELAIRFIHIAKQLSRPPRPYCFLIAKDLSSIDPFQVHYPFHHMWNAYSPFISIPKRRIRKLNELKNLTSLQGDNNV